jgi:hypothetical protein
MTLVMLCFGWLVVGYMPVCCVSVNHCRQSDPEAFDAFGVKVSCYKVCGPLGLNEYLLKELYICVWGSRLHPGMMVLMAVSSIQLGCFTIPQVTDHVLLGSVSYCIIITIDSNLDPCLS